ncbi:MAG: tRNA pseudouridine(38-40) synthase TruA [Lachnospiraceae bacterium]|nr:tRNA pseudouridine(38-40) synthase TruA [Lachnospiraceae bacterium]
MKRIKLVISYDGTNYVGWQVQKNGVAIEQVINEHLSKLLQEDITIIGASRTDSGVHALGNVAVFDTETKIPAEKICFALNQSLPEDIKIVSSREVEPDFHPRHADCTKTYEYTILNSRVYLPIYRLYADYVYYYLDVEKMRQAAEYLLGEHDFTAFSSSGGQQRSPVRTIYRIDISEEKIEMPKDVAWLEETEKNSFEPKRIKIRITGNGFLYNMVRIIAGTLEKAGMGVFPPEHVKEILDSCDRSLSAPKAAACGLTLIDIEYKAFS